MDELQQIAASNLSEIEKLTRAFRLVTDKIIAYSEGEIELLRALGDSQELIKEQIKQSTIQHAQSIYAQCHLLVTGRKAWDD
jgi:hypothetical protein